KIVFEHSSSQCLRCHKIGNHGGIAGPVLDSVGSTMNGRELLESLLVPSKRIAEGFGESSAMPPVAGVLDYREIRDVVAYLKSLQTN
ncbi:MAG: c-type cytochrome, partial [Planctomycetota bacterium]|nr:c-type cytochrome [Planctomycetota bacterium]